VTPALAQLEPATRRLASLVSVAARIDRTVLRRLRLELLDTDVTVESDLWFSNIVAMRSGDEISLGTEYLDELRELLVDSNELGAARTIVKDVHRLAPALVVLEETLIELGLTGASRATIQAKLGEALATIRDQSGRAKDISDWALSALPRLPPSVRGTAAAWSLAIAAEAHLGFAVDLGEQTATDEVVLDPNVATTSLSVHRTYDALVLGSPLGVPISVPATTPLVVTVQIGDERSTVSVHADEIKRIPVEADAAVVITSLKGARWRVRAEPAHGVSPMASVENGRWILVDGTAALQLSWEHYELAKALGRSLADNGYSLITLGRQGVSHVVARSFMDALAPRGFTSGIYPLLHVVETNTRPDFWERGRALFPPHGTTPADDALDHADAVFVIGEPVPELREGARTQELPYRELAAPAPVDNPTRVCERAIERLAVAPAAPVSRAAAEVVRVAAIALDQRDLAAYNRTLQQLERDAMGRGLDVGALLRDPRPSHRLVGYQVQTDLPAELALEALLRERDTVRRFWETRTLWFALEALRRYPRGSQVPLDRAIAAACASIECDLGVNAFIDPRREIRSLLSEVCGSMPAYERARGIAGAALRYEETRQSTPPSDARTQAMTAIVEEIRGRFGVADVREIDVWFTSGREGQRIAALALLLAPRAPAGLAHVHDAIASSRSAFEQYTALRVVQAMQSQLAPSDAEQFQLAIELQRAPGGVITPQDPTRWSLSAELVRALSRRVDLPS